MQKYPFIPARDFSFILCKYLHFIYLVENLRTSLRKINGHGVSLENLCINLRINKWKILMGMLIYLVYKCISIHKTCNLSLKMCFFKNACLHFHCGYMWRAIFYFRRWILPTWMWTFIIFKLNIISKDYF